MAAEASSSSSSSTPSAVGGEEPLHLLVVIVDASDSFTHSCSLQDPAQRLSISQCLDAVMTLMNSYLLMSHENSVAVCLCHPAGSEIVYPDPRHKELSTDDPRLLSGKYEPLVHINGVLTDKIQRVMEDHVTSPPHSVPSSSLLSGALSRCLCYIHRCTRETPVGRKLQSRILVIRSSRDSASQYISTMNCIFAAQKNNVPIDSCVLWQDSGFLQQATDITGGLYALVTEPAGLLQYLLWVFLPNQSTREHLTTPTLVEIDYRAACFCHHSLVETGFVCSVCLSIFCQSTPFCSTCQTHFKLPNLALLGKPKKKKNHKLKSNGFSKSSSK